jgi:hypothetical protein
VQTTSARRVPGSIFGDDGQLAAILYALANTIHTLVGHDFDQGVWPAGQVALTCTSVIFIDTPRWHVRIMGLV